MAALPFDQADLKVALQQSAAGQKDLKESMPKKEPKAKAKAKAKPILAPPCQVRVTMVSLSPSGAASRAAKRSMLL